MFEFLGGNLMVGIAVGILIGWNVFPQPEAVKPVVAWLQEKLKAVWALYNAPKPVEPPAPTVPVANTAPTANTV